MKKIIKYIIITFILVLTFISLLLISNVSMFNDLKIKEADVIQQIAIEKKALKQYNPILNYIENYNLKYGKYPYELPLHYKNISSDYFEGFEYYLTEYESYILRIFPKQGPIEYYQPKKFYHWRVKDKGMEDGVLDNKYYYNIDENWQAIHFQYYTRYNNK